MNKSTKEIYVFSLRFPDFSRDDVLKGARTLSRKPVIFNGRKLECPENMLYFAEYDDRTNEVKVVLITVETEIQEICSANKELFAKASILEKCLPDLFFDSLILSSEPIDSGHKIGLNKVPNLETAMNMLFPH